MKCLRTTATARLAVLAALVWLGAAATTSVRAQVLDQVPSDALFVIKFNNLQAVSDKVAKFAGELGIDALAPEFADPLGSMKEELHITDGLDAAGEMAFVMLKPAEGADPGDSMLVLMPVSDYKAFVGNFADAKTDGGVTTFTPEGKNKEMHAVQWGKYAAVSEHASALAKKPAGLKLAGLAAKEAKEKDAFMFINIPALSEMALPEIAKARASMNKDIDQELGKDADAKQFAGVAKAAAGQALNIAEGFMRDTTAATFSMHLNDEGIAMTATADFKPDSYAGKLAAQFKAKGTPDMAGLPDRKYFAAGGMVNAPEAMSQVIGDLLDPISKELAAADAGKSLATAIDAWKRGAGATKRFTFGYPMPTGALGADSIIQSVVVISGDSKVIADAQKQMLQGVADVMKLLPADAGAKMDFELTPAGKTVGDVKLDSYAFNMTLDENNPQAAQAQQMMAFIYGPAGMGGTFGPVSKDTFLLVQGGTDKLLDESVKAAKAPKDAISALAHVKTVAGQLPENRLAVEYIFLDNIITSGVKYAQGFGLPVKISLPPNLPPIGVAAATEGSAVRIDGFIPTKLVQSVVAAGMQTYMEMQGGGGEGGGDAAPGDGL